jgi:hypothetical protein
VEFIVESLHRGPADLALLVASGVLLRTFYRGAIREPVLVHISFRSLDESDTQWGGVAPSREDFGAIGGWKVDKWREVGQSGVPWN